MTQQAARVGDDHACPSHVGGPILPAGCPTVVIEGRAAARVSDTCQCRGPIDAIGSGTPTVLIDGLPAARLGDSTLHGGIIIAGCATVLIGGVSVAVDVDALFTDEYLRSLIGWTFEGADTRELNEAMQTLWDYRHDPDHPEAQRALEAVARLRGRPLPEIQAEWAKFRSVLAEQERIGALNGKDPISWDPSRSPNFMGSTTQLRSGQIVGDAFGFDPVFGSLLNPSSGLVGPGQDWNLDAGNFSVGYHGVVHDAGGYLYNYHNQGPGYDYLRLERSVISTGNPLAGQVSGIAYWEMLALEHQATAIYDWAASGVSGAYNTASGVVSQGIDKLGEIGSSIWDRWR
jgi:uncharacterized Zn-binding protein involved in type VI secretion